MANERLRGWIGEQSFEIVQGARHLSIFAEAIVFSSAYRIERKLGANQIEARQRAGTAVQEFMRQRAEEDGES